MELLYRTPMKLEPIRMVIPDEQSILLFLASSVILIITPGPAMIYIVTRSVGQGVRAGFFSVLGIELGTVIHIIAAGFGFAILLASSPGAVALVTYVGGSYLVLLGFQQFRIKKSDPPTDTLQNGQSSHQIFWQGVLVNVLNVKTVLFFLAFLPQFIDPSKGHVSSQIIFLGMLFVITAIAMGSLLVLVSGRIRKRLLKTRSYFKLGPYISGGVYILLGIAVVITH